MPSVLFNILMYCVYIADIFTLHWLHTGEENKEDWMKFVIGPVIQEAKEYTAGIHGGTLEGNMCYSLSRLQWCHACLDMTTWPQNPLCGGRTAF